MTPDQSERKKIPRSLLLRGSTKAAAAAATKPQLALEAGKTMVQAAMSNPETFWSTAETVITAFGNPTPLVTPPIELSKPIAITPAESAQVAKPATIEEAEPADAEDSHKPEPAENPYTSVDTMLRAVKDAALRIEDPVRRIHELGYGGKAAASARRPDVESEFHNALMAQGSGLIADAEITATATRASAEIYREKGDFEMADGLMKSVNPDALWYQETAVAKRAAWERSGKTDPNLDPKKDLEEARRLLFSAMEPAPQEITSYSNYALTHLRATGNITESNGYLDSAHRIYRSQIDTHTHNMLDRKQKDIGTEAAIQLTEHAEALAKAYSAVGQSIQARWTVWDFTNIAPKTVEVAQMEARSYQQIANDALARGNDRDLEPLGSADASAIDAIGRIKAMPDGPEKAELMATVGAEMQAARCMTAMKVGNKNKSGEPLERLADATSLVETAPNDLLKAKGYLAIGKVMEFGKSSWFDMAHMFTYVFHAQTRNLTPELAEQVMVTYRELVNGYTGIEKIEEAKQILAKMERLAKGDENIAPYAEALADVAKAEALQIDAELIKKHIGDIQGREGIESDVKLKESGCHVWVIVNYYKLSGSIEQTAKDYTLTPDEVYAALAYYKQHKEIFDGKIANARGEYS